MSETVRAWQRAFKGQPIEASEVRAWASRRATHPDAAAVANELFVAILGTGADVIEVKVATTGDRFRITATGPEPLPVRHSHGPGWRIVSGLSRTSGVTADERGLWAEIRDEVTA